MKLQKVNASSAVSWCMQELTWPRPISKLSQQNQDQDCHVCLGLELCITTVPKLRTSKKILSPFLCLATGKWNRDLYSEGGGGPTNCSRRLHIAYHCIWHFKRWISMLQFPAYFGVFKNVARPSLTYIESRPILWLSHQDQDQDYHGRRGLGLALYITTVPKLWTSRKKKSYHRPCV